MLPEPAPFLTVMTPLATTQGAAVVWSLARTHWSRLEPLNRTMASDGGALSVAPGVTTGGTGDQTSVSSGLGLGVVCGAAVWATAVPARARNVRAMRIVLMMQTR